ncbi:MAG: LEA type 2 family protein [Chitinophagales bacterium]
MRYLLLCCSILMATACSVQSPQYKGYSPFTIDKEEAGPVIHTGVLLHNPNPIGVSLRNAEFKVTVNSVELGDISLDESVHIKRKQDFMLPVTFRTTYSSLSGAAMANLPAILSGSPIPLTVEGELRVRKWLFFHKTFAVDYQDKIDLKDIQL